MVEHPPDYDERIVYEYRGIRHTDALDPYSSMVTDAGTSWTDRVKKVAAKAHLNLWKVTNRLKNLSSIQVVQLCANKEEMLRMEDEIRRQRAELAAFRGRFGEL